MNKENPFTFFLIHPKAVLLEWKQEPNGELLYELNALKKIIESNVKLVSQITQGYRSLLIQFSSQIKDSIDLKNELYILHLKTQSNERISNVKHWTIPVCYEDPFALDIVMLSSKLKLDPKEIINLHTQKIYTVYFIGFLPGFLYLQGLDSHLFFPRKESPRLTIPEGAVAIGGKQTGIYPSSSPGGWHIIGNTPISLFNPKNKTPCFATSGDTLSFKPISLKEYHLIKNEANPIAYLNEIK